MHVHEDALPMDSVFVLETRKKKVVDGDANPRQLSKVSITKDVNRVGVPSPRELRCRTQQTPRAPCRDHIFASVCTDRSERGWVKHGTQ